MATRVTPRSRNEAADSVVVNKVAARHRNRSDFVLDDRECKARRHQSRRIFQDGNRCPSRRERNPASPRSRRQGLDASIYTRNFPSMDFQIAQDGARRGLTNSPQRISCLRRPKGASARPVFDARFTQEKPKTEVSHHL